jgi:hypothetical protein
VRRKIVILSGSGLSAESGPATSVVPRIIEEWLS